MVEPVFAAIGKTGVDARGKAEIGKEESGGRGRFLQPFRVFRLPGRKDCARFEVGNKGGTRFSVRIFDACGIAMAILQRELIWNENQRRNVNRESLIPKLPLIIAWIDHTLAEHAAAARPIMSFGFKRLPQFYSSALLLRAKVVVVDAVPVPPLRSLGLSEFGAFELGNYRGITLKDTYFVERYHEDDESLHFHELVHVVQWARLEAENFLLAYAEGLVTYGYRNSSLEVMAYDFQNDFDQNCPAFDVESAICAQLNES